MADETHFGMTSGSGVSSRFSLRTGLLRSILLYVAFLALSSCGCAQDPWISIDDWYELPDHQSRASAWQDLVSENVHPVLPSKHDESIRMLEMWTWSKLDRDTAEELTGVSFEEKGMAYLARGLCLACHTGRFHVSINEDRIWIHHSSLADRALPMTRFPVVVILPFEPEEVFVSCSSHG